VPANNCHHVLAKELASTNQVVKLQRQRLMPQAAEGRVFYHAWIFSPIWLMGLKVYWSTKTPQLKMASRNLWL
jgi:hypothetical protein